MKIFLLRGFGLVGIVLFVPLFLLTFSGPQAVEKSARAFIEWKLDRAVDAKIDSVAWPRSQTLQTFLGSRAEALNQKADAELAVYKQLLKNDLPEMMAEALANVRDLDCECRQKWKERLAGLITLQIASVEETKKKLAAYAQAKYMQIVEKLTRDVRIFLGVNAVVFLLLSLAAFLKPKASEHLFLPGALLLLSTLICSYFYLFEQNWFYTVIYNEYTGFGYLAYLLAVFALLCDIVFNKARVVTEIINMFASAVGSAFSVAPC